jgi:hypothetical protein
VAVIEEQVRDDAELVPYRLRVFPRIFSNNELLLAILDGERSTKVLEGIDGATFEAMIRVGLIKRRLHGITSIRLNGKKSLAIIEPWARINVMDPWTCLQIVKRENSPHLLRIGAQLRYNMNMFHHEAVRLARIYITSHFGDGRRVTYELRMAHRVWRVLRIPCGRDLLDKGERREGAAALPR